MKICFFGIYDPQYPRNEILLAGLARIGVEVIECRADWRDPKRYRTLATKLRALQNNYDYVYAAHPSSVPAILARFVSRKPVIADAFYSMFDTVVHDRREISWWHPRAIKLLVLDWLGIIVAHAVTTDTDAHARYWSTWWGIRREKIYALYLGVNDSQFHPLPPRPTGHFLVHFHGTYIPVQGVEKIIEAARLCASESRIQFRLIGTGQDLPKTRALAARYKLTNVEFIEARVGGVKLNDYMAEADMVLGIFGDSAKARRAIPNKVYEGLAAKKAVMTMDSPAVREIFSGEDMLLVGNNPRAMADGILFLAQDEKMRADSARHGYDTVRNYFPAPVATSLITILSRLT